MRIEVSGHGIELEEHGEGVPFLLIHGFPLSAEIFAPIRPALGGLARVITPDLRGFGGSDKPLGEYSMASLAADVVGLADALDLERFALGGHSMGGYVALRVLAEHPERIAGLALIDSRAEADTAEGAGRRNAAIERILGGDRAGFLDEFVGNLVGPTTHERAPRFVAELRAIAEQVPGHVLVGCLEGMRDRPDSTRALTSVAVPALVMVGEEDAITPPETARSLAQTIPGARLAVIDGCGHTPTVERPIAAADALARFLREVAG